MTEVLTGLVIDEHTELSLHDLSCACATSVEWIIQLVDEGVLEPVGHEPAQWRFPGTCLQRARAARHLQRDLEINLAGVALALELMEEIEALRARLGRFE